jgi:hypothetical protein
LENLKPDAPTITAQYAVSNTENVNPAVSPAMPFNSAKLSDTENINLADTISNTAALTFSSIENFTSADSPSIKINYVVTNTDGITSADANTVTAALLESITENLTAAIL